MWKFDYVITVLSLLSLRLSNVEIGWPLIPLYLGVLLAILVSCFSTFRLMIVPCKNNQMAG